MAAKKKKKVMVLHDEGATAPTAAPMASSPPAPFVFKPGQVFEEHGILLTKKEVDIMAKSSPGSAKDKVSAMLPSIESAAKSNPQLENLPPDRTCKGVKVTLDNNNRWNEFFRYKTEMILTKQGCRMFPYCRFRISGLEPFQKYALLMDIHQVDNKQYKWTGKDWQANGKAETDIQRRPFVHSESPNTGHYWMQNPVSFYKLKLTNNTAEPEGNVVLHTSHRYLPRLHLVLADKASEDIQLDGPDIITFTFPQTEFFAVTSYQNPRFTQLKVDYNPFAKGLREDGLKSSPLNASKKDEAKSSNGLNPMKKSLKSLLANNKPKNTKAVNHGLKVTEVGNVTDTPANKGTSGSSESTEEKSRNFSELIRESHVKLRRCNLKKSSTTCTVRLTETDSLVSKDKVEEAAGKKVLPPIAHPKGPPGKTGKKTTIQERVMPTKGVQNCILPSSSRKPVQRMPQAVTNQSVDESGVNGQKPSVGSSINSEPQITISDGQAPEKAKPHKRPAPVPLPALALYLQQLRSKSSPGRTKLTSPPVMPSKSSPQLTTTSTSPSRSQSSHGTAPSVGLNADPIYPDGNASSSVSGSTFCPASQPSDPVLVSDPAVGATASPTPCPTTECSHLNADAPFPPTVPETQTPVPETLLPETGPVLPSSDQSLNAPSSPLSMSPFLSETEPSQESSESATTVLSVQELQPHLPETMKYSAPDLQSHISDLSSHSPALSSLSILATSESPTYPSLPGPEHLSCLEPQSNGWLPDTGPSLLSPAVVKPAIAPLLQPPTSSAETLEPLLAPGVHVAGLESTAGASMPGFGQSRGYPVPAFSSIPVLPPPDPFLTSFTSFLPTPHSGSFNMGSSALFSTSRPSLSLSHPGPLDFASLSSSLPSDPDPFQVNDQSLPFPVTLSPLALPLSLSPSFSSLGPDPLSPTPSFSELVHFFANNDDLEIDEDFTNNEPVPPIPCTPSIETPSIPVHAQPTPDSKPRKLKGRSRKRKGDKTLKVPVISVPADMKLQPNLEEVEEQLFVSFTSKEALEIHIGDSNPAPQIVEAPPQKTSETMAKPPETNGTETLEERIAALEEVLLTDLKLMKHRQVIHPVLQEVGLKISLLDPTLVIDLQYLGVRLPIPPPFSTPEQSSENLAPSPSSSAVFISRTGKTNDFTQIKGWREKFVPESSSSSSSSKPEVVPSSDGTVSKNLVPSSDGTVSKNLSAFCSDMLDEYLANEGKLIDERAASFSQTVVTPVTYELPSKSTSYVRTLDSVLKKKSLGPTSSIISDFIPPSKRPKLPPPRPKKPRSTDTGPKKGSKQSRTKPLEASTTAHPVTPASAPKPALSPAPPVSESAPSEHTAPITHSPKDSVQKKKTEKKAKDSSAPPDQAAPITLSSKDSVQEKKKKKKKKKPKDSLKEAPPGASDMAPLESDSELGPSPETHPLPNSNPLMTKGMMKQKDLEDGVTWEGKHRTYVTEERAEVALSSLFTLEGFVCENPTAPVRIIKCRAPPCLNMFCRLGCVCSSLAQERRITHCGKTECIFGCSCLRQKVVLLKNLEVLDSSTSDEGLPKKKKRTKRMRMAYALKEAESVSQPAQRVRTLWKLRDVDPEPVHKPTPVYLPSPPAPSDPEDGSMTCARVRVFQRRKKEQSNQPTPESKEQSNQSTQKSKDKSSQPAQKSKEKSSKRTQKNKEQSSQPTPKSKEKSSQPTPKNKEQSSQRTKKNKKQSSQPTQKNKEQSNQLPQKDHVSQPKVEDLASATHSKITTENPSPNIPPSTELARRLEIVSECRWNSRSDRNLILKVVCEHMAMDRLTDPFWVRGYLVRPQSQGLTLEGEAYAITYKVHISQVAQAPSEVQVVEVEEEEDGLEDWQRAIEDDMMEEGEEEAQKEKEKEEEEEEELRKSEQEMKDRKEKNKELKYQGLPFITGVSHAGVLIANKKQPGGLDQGLVQVNGKPYPCAKIQLGRMGAMHPANRLAAYLTGRLRIGSQEPVKQASASSCSSSSSSSTTTSTTTSAAQCTQSAATSAPGGTTSEPQGPAVSVGAGALKPTADAKAVPVHKMAVPVQKLVVPVPGTNTVVKMTCSSSQPLSPLTTSQRMVLQPLRSSTGATVYRTPDGKLIQLVPLSKLQALNPNLVVQKGATITLTKPVPSTSASSSASLPSSAPPSGQLLITVPPPPSAPPLRSSNVIRISPRGSASTALPTVSVLSSPRSLTLRPITLSGPAPSAAHGAAPALKFLTQKGTSTLKIIPTLSEKERILAVCSKDPAQGVIKAVAGSFTLLKPPTATPLVTLKPAGGQTNVTESGVKASATASPPSSTPPLTVVGLVEGKALRHTTDAPVTSSKAPATGQDDIIRLVIGQDDIRVGEQASKETGEREEEIVEVTDDDTGEGTDSEESENFEVDAPACPLEAFETKLHHNVMERWRRGDLLRRVEQLREVLELDKKSSKLFTLRQAKQEIKILQRTGRLLKKQKASLLHQRAECFRALSHLTTESGEAILEKIKKRCAEEKRMEESSRTAGETSGERFLEGSGKKPSLVGEETQVVSLLDETEEETDNSSDDEKAHHIHIISDEEEGGESVDTETASENADAQSKTPGVPRTNRDTAANKKGENRTDSGKEQPNPVESDTPACYGVLKQLLDLDDSSFSRETILDLAHKEIEELNEKCRKLEKQKAVLTLTRAEHLHRVSVLTGKGVERSTSSTQKSQEDVSWRVYTIPLVGPAPPVPPKRAAPQPVLQPRPDSDRPRTYPNILSRRKPPTPPPSTTQREAGMSQPLHATLLPMGQMPLMLPGQQVITLAPGSSLLHQVCLSGLSLHQSSTSGVATVTISIPGLSGQPIQVKAPPHSLNPAFDSAALYTTTTNPSGSNVLSLVTVPPQPAEQVQSQLQNQIPVQVTTKTMARAQAPETPLPSLVQGVVPSGVGPTDCVEISSDDDNGGNNEDESLKILLDEIVFLNQQMSSEEPGKPAEAELCGGPPPERGVGGGRAAPGGGDDERSLSPLFLSLDEDPGRTGEAEMEKASSSLSQLLGQSHGQGGAGGSPDPPSDSGWDLPASGSGSGSGSGLGPFPAVNGHGQEQSRPPAPPPPAPSAAAKRGGLTPPPLLQMKVGGVAETADASENVVEKKGAEPAWRPMPRLAPLGLKTNPQS